MNTKDVETRSSDQYETLCKSRRYARAKITRLCNTIHANLATAMNEGMNNQYSTRLCDLKTEIGNVNRDIHTFMPDDENFDNVMDEELTYDEKISEALAALESVSLSSNNLDKHSLSEYERFVYLRGQLGGGPKALINSLVPNEQTYACARDLQKGCFRVSAITEI